MDTVTFQKLKDIEARLASVETQMSDPAVLQDPSAYQKLAREAKDITPLAEGYRAYKDTLGELTKVQEMIRTEDDPELREMAHEELRTLESRRGRAGGADPRCCSSPRTPTTRRTSCWRSAPAPAATRRRCSPPRSSACTSATPSGSAGRWTWSPSPVPARAASRK